ncbi:Prephenate dehydratase-domain-containing protein [Xylaria bambusicola]|uniref:Prephenate dehydratase-domain-containing protein n=1 Tax=Xylaria bambusicola TaxID=326684 RepID=UPI0020088F8C|nr:Prephenate dehydratase-domain-containing protein [Xylaria bambusicola]KAI0526478.1 Prephenate dehydratase-domain-containing protein [Xylaria bambusicola]
METDDQAALGGASPKPVVCFLGPTSSYTHQATMQVFPADQFNLMPVTTIKDIFDTTQSGGATYGVVPFENSTNGSVVFTLDNFADRSNLYGDLNVCREIYLDVHHYLVGYIAPQPPAPHHPSSTPTSVDAHAQESGVDEEAGDGGQRDKTKRSQPLHPISHVRRVYSHPQAFGQCTEFMGSWLRGIETVDVSSTSRAAELALADSTGESAAISSAVAAEQLGLDVLAQNIEDRDDNTTRFFVLRKGVDGGAGVFAPTASRNASPTALNTQRDNEEEDDAELLSRTKSLLSFTVPHRSPGALADVLSCFRRGGLNLTSINSRPSLAGAAAFEYIFFVEFEGHRFRDPRARVARVLEDVAAVARTSRWLGSWENMAK